jgi:deoxyribodipyrimidine photo-lyase
MMEVETNLIVPVWEASDKENFSAGTFRPRIKAKLDYYLKKVRHRKPLYDSLGMRIESFDISNIDDAVSRLDIDRSVKQTSFKGGTDEAKRLLAEFIKKKLDSYPVKRNDPNQDGTSHMSPYLHFGQISPLYIALRVIDSNSKGKEAYLEELIVRRELSHNYVFYNSKYDKYVSLPPWAKNTLNFHGRDKREYVYSLQDFEGAKTHDAYWNATQKEMVLTGKMHGYMRMYWGKKILEWSKNPKEGWKALRLLFI